MHKPPAYWSWILGEGIFGLGLNVGGAVEEGDVFGPGVASVTVGLRVVGTGVGAAFGLRQTHMAALKPSEVQTPASFCQAKL